MPVFFHPQTRSSACSQSTGRNLIVQSNISPPSRFQGSYPTKKCGFSLFLSARFRGGEIRRARQSARALSRDFSACGWRACCLAATTLGKYSRRHTERPRNPTASSGEKCRIGFQPFPLCPHRAAGAPFCDEAAAATWERAVPQPRAIFPRRRPSPRSRRGRLP